MVTNMVIGEDVSVPIGEAIKNAGHDIERHSHMGGESSHESCVAASFKGSEVLSINGTSVVGISTSELRALLQGSRPQDKESNVQVRVKLAAQSN